MLQERTPQKQPITGSPNSTPDFPTVAVQEVSNQDGRTDWPTQTLKQVTGTDSSIPVSVVICARNREHMIGRCLDAVWRGNPAEIIVVDDNSTDNTPAVARQKGAKVIANHGGAGLGAARQLGAGAAKHEYVIFVDTDVVVEPETFGQLLHEAVAKNYDVIMAELRTWASTPTYWQEADLWRRQVQFRKGIASVLGCGATLVRRDLLMQVGFDPAFKGAAEDADFCFRARATGAVLAHGAEAVAYHEDRETLGEVVRQKIWHGRGLARMITRYRRDYLRLAANQVDSSVGATKMNMRFLPYILVSWSCTALGLALELLAIARDPALRKRLRAQ
jgi:glycosyltransferase involved in cell wall biosynthesis